jgi:hypothetical protein
MCGRVHTPHNNCIPPACVCVYVYVACRSIARNGRLNNQAIFTWDEALHY